MTGDGRSARGGGWLRGRVEDWADESLEIGRRAYRIPGTDRALRPGDEIGPDYVNANLPLAVERVAQSGVRLAAMLNEILRLSRAGHRGEAGSRPQESPSKPIRGPRFLLGEPPPAALPPGRARLAGPGLRRFRLLDAVLDRTLAKDLVEVGETIAAYNGSSS